MGVKVREKKKGSDEWYIYVHHKGKRGARKIGKKKIAEKVAKLVEAQLIMGDYSFFQDEDPGSEASEEDRELMTFRFYAAVWLEDYIKPLRTASTHERYEQLLRDHINPVIGKMDIREINRGHIKKLLLGLLKKGLSKSSIETINNVISGVFNQAIDEEVVTVNPCSNLLKRLNLKRDKGGHLDPFNREETRHFLNICQEHFPDDYSFFFCAFRTGLRLGELLALEWSTIDWHGKFIMVQSSFNRGIVSPTKSKTSRRVDMTDQLIDVLKDLHTQRKKEGFKSGGGGAVEIIFHGNGKHIPQNTIRKRFKRILRKAGLREIRFHDIRHTYVSNLISSGATLTYVQEQVGHHNINITVKNYNDYIPQTDQAEVNLLDDQGMARNQNATYTQP